MVSLWIVVVLCLLAYLFATKTSDQVSRLWLGYWACIAGTGIVGVRLVVRILLIAFTDGSVLHRRVLIIAESQELAHKVVSQQQEDGGNIVVGILILSDWGHVQTVSSIASQFRISSSVMALTNYYRGRLDTANVVEWH